MKKRLFFVIFTLVLFALNTSSSQAGTEKQEGIKVSNPMFSLTLPKEMKGKFVAEKGKDNIRIFDKTSKEEGFGGYAFGVIAFKEPKDHAMMPGGKKIGELTDKKGILYDIVLDYPTDVQYDYTSDKHETYDVLYDYGDFAGENLKGIKGSTYFDAQGTRGEDLYKDVLTKHLKALEEKWDSSKLEEENMSYMYNVLSQPAKKSKKKTDVLEKAGYTYYDTNGDGIDELLIGEIAQGNWKGIIYDIYTMVDRRPAHVVSGGTRDRYFICDDVFICNEYSSGALESGWHVFTLVENSTELFPQVGFKYDGYTNRKNPWFISYNFQENQWDNVSQATFKERKKVFDKYERFDFVPFKTLKNAK
ncbi:hypothetical protein IKQ26_05005 [bacterium]|nr:hypothetical protein [bacterium]